MTTESLLARIDAFLEAHGISPTAFGMSAVGDPNFVRDLRAGREPRRRVVSKVEDYMATQPQPAQAAAEARV